MPRHPGDPAGRGARPKRRAWWTHETSEHRAYAPRRPSRDGRSRWCGELSGPARVERIEREGEAVISRAGLVPPLLEGLEKLQQPRLEPPSFGGSGPDLEVGQDALFLDPLPARALRDQAAHLVGGAFEDGRDHGLQGVSLRRRIGAGGGEDAGVRAELTGDRQVVLLDRAAVRARSREANQA